MAASTPSTAGRSLRVVELGLRFVVGLLVTAIVVLVTAQIFFRYVLASPIVWSEEFTTLCYQWLSYLGAALAVRYRGHFGVDFVVRKLEARWHRQLTLLTHATIWLVGVFMIVYGLRIVEASAAQMFPTLGFSVGTGYLVLPIAGVLFLLMDVAVALERRDAAGAATAA